MATTSHDTGMQDVRDTVTRLEERGIARDASMAELKAMLTAMSVRLDRVASDVQDAKTALRVGFWISTTIVPAAAMLVGWVARHLWVTK